MNLIKQIEEYKAKLDSLAGKAAQAEDFEKRLNEVLTEKETLSNEVASKDQAILTLSEEKTKAEQERDALKQELEQMKQEKQASDEKAMEIINQLGLKTIPVVTVTETSKPTAEQIREKYMAITDSNERAKFFAENRNAILNGIIE